MNILITEKADIHRDAISLLKKKHKIFFLETSFDNNLIDVLFVRTYTIINKKYLNTFSNLKYVLRAGVGLDNIDLEECKRRNIHILNSPGSNANAVAELVIGLMLMLSRNIKIQSSNIEHRKWRIKGYLGTEIKNKIIGIIGCGAIGRLIAKKLETFEVESILGYDPFLNEEQLERYGIKKVELLNLFKNSDYITLHLPFNKDTRDLISKNELKLMKTTAFLINTSRGGIVNENALIKAIKEKNIAGAALDVFENEPHISKDLLHLNNLILTPHLGAYTIEADRSMSVETVNRFLEVIK